MRTVHPHLKIELSNWHLLCSNSLQEDSNKLNPVAFVQPLVMPLICAQLYMKKQISKLMLQECSQAQPSKIMTHTQIPIIRVGETIRTLAIETTK